MLVHFPGALYPFSLGMDLLATLMGNAAYAETGRYALISAIATGVLAMIYGASDFLQLDSTDKAWKTAGIHGLLNLSWFIVYSILLFYRLKHEVVICGWGYLSFMGLTTAGLLISNYLGAELIIKYRMGVDPPSAKHQAPDTTR